MEEVWDEDTPAVAQRDQPRTFGRGRGRGIQKFKPDRGSRPFNGDRGNFDSDRHQNDDGGERRQFRGNRDRNDENGDAGERRQFRANRDRNDENGEDGAEARKPPVTYIPPEPTEDENEMYGSGLNTGINFEKYDHIDIKVEKQNGDSRPIPAYLTSFAESGLRPYLLSIVDKCGYKKPTPVQRATIPIIMLGNDLMACAQTGSGKTAAFLLPIVNKLLTDCDSNTLGDKCKPQALILAPTRELAIQIFEECRKFTHGSRLKCAICYGGTGVGHQISKLRPEVNIIVATVGRLCDFMERGRFDFSDIKFVVLDEADRMLDMGFKPKIEEIMSHSTMAPKSERQTLMFSATFPNEVRRLARDFLSPNYLYAAIGIVGGACSDVEQRFIAIDMQGKRDKLLEIIKERPNEKTLVFVETKRYTDMLTVILCEDDLPAVSIHGDREQQQREEALRDFRSGRRNILVATNVASRGLDVKGVEHVINFDMPKDVEEYVHRIGRTGRLGNRGLATTFYDPSKDAGLVPQFIDILRGAGQEVPDCFQDQECSGHDSYQNGAQEQVNAVDNEEW